MSFGLGYIKALRKAAKALNQKAFDATLRRLFEHHHIKTESVKVPESLRKIWEAEDREAKMRE